MPVVATAITSGLARANQGTGILAAGTTDLTLGSGTNTFAVSAGNAGSVGSGAAFTLTYDKTEGKLNPGATVTQTGVMDTATDGSVTIGIDALIAGGATVANGGTGGTVLITAASNVVSAVVIQTEVSANGYSAGWTDTSTITLTSAQANAISALTAVFGAISGANLEIRYCGCNRHTNNSCKHSFNGWWSHNRKRI